MAAYYPPVGFHFLVEFEGLGTESKDHQFQSVSGLSVDIETEEIAEGGENRFKHKFPVKTKYPNLVLKRGLLIDPNIAKFFFISGGLFLSIMWPSIFDLAIAGLGKNTGKASSFLIMMILGGGVIPLVQGGICDLDLTNPDGIFGISYTHFSYIVPLIGFAYLAFYGFYCPKILEKQGVSHVISEGGGH